MFKAICIITVMGAPTFQITDDLKVSYPTLKQCYTRAAQMITAAAYKMPLLQATAICVDIQQPATDKPAPDAKPKKGKPVNYTAPD